MKGKHSINTSRGTRRALSRIPNCKYCRKVKLFDHERRARGVCAKCWVEKCRNYWKVEADGSELGITDLHNSALRISFRWGRESGHANWKESVLIRQVINGECVEAKPIKEWLEV